MIDSLKKIVANKFAFLGGNSLKARGGRSAMLLGMGTATERIMKLIRNMILARILAPSDFDLIALILASTMALEAFVEVGVRQSVIQNKNGSNPDYLNMAWWFQTVRGFLIYITAFLIAPWISSFYGRPELSSLMRVAFLSIFFNSLISPGTYILEKKLQFGKYVLWLQGSGLCGITITLLIAFFVMQNTWALVIGYVSEFAIKFLLSFILCPFRPRFKIDTESLSDIWLFAKRMFGVPILATITFQADVFILGKFATEGQIGVYFLARQLAVQLFYLFSKVLTTVLLPIFSARQTDKQLLSDSVKKITNTIASFGVPITTFLVVCSAPILSVVYGRRFATSAIPFAILCVYSLVRIQGSVLAQIYFATGRPDLHRRFVILRIIVLGCLLYPAVLNFGAVGIASSVLLANIVGLCMQVIWVNQTVGLRFYDYVRCWREGVNVILIVVIPAVLLRLYGNQNAIINIAVGATACFTACITSQILLKNKWKMKPLTLERV